jgi:hypothetical protein
MTIGARFAKWGLGLFVFGLFLTFGVIGHYCVGASADAGELFKRNVPNITGKNAWLLGQTLFFAVYWLGMLLAFNDLRHVLTRVETTAARAV